MYIDPELSEGEAAPGSLQAFLEKVSLVADADQIPENESGVVTLMTLHTAKGLEFPVVFLTGWEEGQFPHMRSQPVRNTTGNSKPFAVRSEEHTSELKSRG